MQYDELITVSTPEGVDLQLELAGVGSRFLADLLDGLIRLVPIIIIAIVGATNGGLGLAVGLVVIFLLIFAYDVLFETRAAGRTPGKKAVGLRVVTETGGPVDLRGSAIRNLLRLVDFLPSYYLVGVLTIIATKRNQRLGDLAARTLVIREPVPRPSDAVAPVIIPALPAPMRPPEPVPVSPSAADGWDLSAITEDDIAAAQRFLERRAALPPEPRRQLAARLAFGIRAKAKDSARELADEPLIERIVATADPRLHMGSADAWDVSAVTAEEMVALRRFLERRSDLDRASRDRLVTTLADRLRPKVQGVDLELENERFLERLAAAKAART
jgi:uncharacterized RDD family membrane protein YckC